MRAVRGESEQVFLQGADPERPAELHTVSLNTASDGQLSPNTHMFYSVPVVRVAEPKNISERRKQDLQNMKSSSVTLL
ncbi:hypothetical protein CesoFtcFv8_003013 [Champsocephalus esox]|uniref:Uncharacterized protein n=1 Tax=Champsocephalus esox TaxID=159716 RepID=A0AAN8CZH0_9TELE|nr:hypothetical protein CesoFtcFv8_003013 [Champsocephalus esox]